MDGFANEDPNAANPHKKHHPPALHSLPSTAPPTGPGQARRVYHSERSVLSAHGYGESFPMYPQGNEAEMQMDRRVLVVRTK